MNSRPPKAQPEITIDCVVFTIEDKTLKVALIKRTQQPEKDRFSLPGGFLWREETSLAATKRVLKDKLKLQNIFLEQLYTFDNPKRDPRGHVITISYFALAPIEKLRPVTKNADLQITDVRNAGNLAFDHTDILAYALKRLRTKLGYTNIAYSLLPELFTLSQLQEVYEVILGHNIDKRNFRKKILSLDIIEQTDQQLRGQRHRPARLHRFKNHSYSELEEPIF